MLWCHSASIFSLSAPTQKQPWWPLRGRVSSGRALVLSKDTWRWRCRWWICFGRWPGPVWTEWWPAPWAAPALSSPTPSRWIWFPGPPHPWCQTPVRWAPPPLLAPARRRTYAPAGSPTRKRQRAAPRCDWLGCRGAASAACTAAAAAGSCPRRSPASRACSMSCEQGMKEHIVITPPLQPHSQV